MNLTDLVIGGSEPASDRPHQPGPHGRGAHDHGAHEPWDTVVIGAGLGGLSTAAFLATHGQRVLVLEQHEVVGGSSQAFRREGERYQFDVGVHRVGECEPGGRMRAILDSLGLADRIEWLALDAEASSTITLPGVSMRVPVGWEAYEQRLVETFPSEAESLRRVVATLRAVAGETRAQEEGRTRRALPGRTLPGRALPGPALPGRSVLRWGARPLATLFSRHDLSPAAQTVLAGESGGYSLPPSKVPVAVHAAHLDHHLVSGSWYPRGGGQVIPARLTQVIGAHGGVVRTGVKVDRIMVEGGRTVGVTLVDGEEIHARTVVSNADPKRTYLGLVGRENLSPRLLRRAESWTTALPLFTVHLGVDLDLRERLGTADRWIHPQADLEAFYEATYAGRISAQVPVFLTSGTLKDPTSTRTTPPGESTLTLVTVAPSDKSAWSLRSGGPSAGERYSQNEGYLAAKERLTEAVIDTACLAIPELREHITHRVASSPVTHERLTLATDGSPYGLERTAHQVGRARPDITSPIKGLFLTGAGTSHVPGVLGAITSGVEAASAVLQRDLMADITAGALWGDPALIAAEAPDWDPIRASMPGAFH